METSNYLNVEQHTDIYKHGSKKKSPKNKKNLWTNENIAYQNVWMKWSQCFEENLKHWINILEKKKGLE